MFYSPYRWYAILMEDFLYLNLTVRKGLVHRCRCSYQCLHLQWPRSSHNLSSARPDLQNFVSRRHCTAYRQFILYRAEAGRLDAHWQPHGPQETWHLVPIFHCYNPGHRHRFVCYLFVCAMRPPFTRLEPCEAR